MSRFGGIDGMRIGSRAGLMTKIGAMALVLGGLAGCSMMPDWSKPDPVYGSAKPAQTQPGTSGFPDLADVPENKPDATSDAQQKEIASGLAADRAAAKHTDEVLRGGTEPPAPAPQVSAPSPVQPLKDVPDGSDSAAPEKKSSNDTPALLPVPGRGGHASLAAIKGGVQTAEADTSSAAPATDDTTAETKADPNAEQPVAAAPTTPVEVKPSVGGSSKL